MESIFEQVKAEVDRGRLGLNHGIPFGLPKLESIIDGVTQDTYTLVISSSGSGKTSFVLYAYVYRPLMEHLDDDNFRCTFCSLEMSSLSMFIKLLSIYIFEKFGKVLSYKEILSRKKDYVLDDESYKLVLQCEDWIRKVEKKIEFYDKNVSANSLYAILCKRLEKLGKFTETETRKTYVPNNPDLTYLVVVDHIGLIRPQAGHTLKQEIDLMSAYLVTLREMCHISPVVIQQVNRDHSNATRMSMGMSQFTMNDSKDSGNTVQDCNVMLALYDPFKDGVKTYRGYDVEQMQGKFRTCQVLKNRFDQSDVEIGMSFYGNINYFKELPSPNQISDYSWYASPTTALKMEERTLDQVLYEEGTQHLP